ncbi:MAG: DUF554 domain-containing protein [Clostridiales bacterium]|nr:DUF554 domain-containing protein [Clostridiales bacterium]
MPTGVICNSLAIALGGLLGAALGGRLSDEFKAKLNLLFGICAMGMGISSIALMKNMPAVILSLIAGTLIGIAVHLGRGIERAGAALERGMARLAPAPSRARPAGQDQLMVTTIVLFCASGTGIYGSIVSGMMGDHSILIAKSILDLFTSMIFACTLGATVAAVAVPQFLIFMLLFACARLIYPLTTPVMIDDFKACGGFILIATGLRIAKIKDFPIADMIPAMALVMPLSALWTNCVMPLLG